MKIVRCRDQKSKTLIEFYREISESQNAVVREGGIAMLELLERLSGIPDKRCFYGLTSHHRLNLLAEDTYESPWFVSVAALDRRNYFIEYLMPKHLAPWEYASITGEARTEDRAVDMILTAIRNSEGWASV